MYLLLIKDFEMNTQVIYENLCFPDADIHDKFQECFRYITKEANRNDLTLQMHDSYCEIIEHKTYSSYWPWTESGNYQVLYMLTIVPVRKE